MSDDPIKQFTQRIEMFEKGFTMITNNLLGQLEKVATQTQQIAENTVFIPKVVETNKEIKKLTEKVGLICDSVMQRLNVLSEKMNIP